MHADLDLLCISVYCTADDLLPERPGNARRRLSDAEIDARSGDTSSSASKASSRFGSRARSWLYVAYRTTRDAWEAVRRVEERRPAAILATT
jgi:hypothetical protein